MAIGEFIEHLKSDPEYAWGWYCNIRMPLYDKGISAEKSKECAIFLMKHLFEIDMIEVQKQLPGSKL